MTPETIVLALIMAPVALLFCSHTAHVLFGIGEGTPWPADRNKGNTHD